MVCLLVAVDNCRFLPVSVPSVSRRAPGISCLPLMRLSQRPSRRLRATRQASRRATLCQGSSPPDCLRKLRQTGFVQRRSLCYRLRGSSGRLASLSPPRPHGAVLFWPTSDFVRDRLRGSSGRLASLSPPRPHGAVLFWPTSDFVRDRCRLPSHVGGRQLTTFQVRLTCHLICRYL